MAEKTNKLKTFSLTQYKQADKNNNNDDDNTKKKKPSKPAFKLSKHEFKLCIIMLDLERR